MGVLVPVRHFSVLWYIFQFIMSINNLHPQYAALQQRLQRLKAGIAQKREEAKQLFQQVLEQLRVKLGVVIAKDIKEELTHIKHLLLLGPEEEKNKETGQERDTECLSEQMLGHILRAIQALSAPTGQKSQITAVQLEEDLKKHIASRFVQDQVQLSAGWKKHVRPGDIAEILASGTYEAVTAAFGGAASMLQASIACVDTAASLTKARSFPTPSSADNQRLPSMATTIETGQGR